MARPRVAILLLIWQSREEVLGCLASLRATTYPNWEVLVVDNGSTDGGPEAVRAQFPGATLLPTGANLGYAGGNNVGIRAALARGADYVLILNPDTRVTQEGWLDVLVDAGEGNPDVGVLGPRTIDEAGQVNHGAVVYDYRIAQARRLLPLDRDLVRCDWVGGHALLVKRAVFERVGLLDERLFLFGEEPDFCRRAAQAGWASALVAEAEILHKVGRSRTSVPYVAFYYSNRNRFLIARKHAGLLGFAYFVLRDLLLGGLYYGAMLAGGRPPPFAFVRQAIEPQGMTKVEASRLDGAYIRQLKFLAWRDGLLGNFGRRDLPPRPPS